MESGKIVRRAPCRQEAEYWERQDDHQAEAIERLSTHAPPDGNDHDHSG
jgi:hypothetical protein